LVFGVEVVDFESIIVFVDLFDLDLEDILRGRLSMVLVVTWRVNE
jgi:hypothetical protein